MDRFENGTLFSFLSKTAKVDKFEKGNPMLLYQKMIFPEILAKSKFFEKLAAGVDFFGYFKRIFKSSLNPPPSKVHELGEGWGIERVIPGYAMFDF